MNFVSICAQTTEEPREVYISATSTAVRCNALIPAVGNKAPTPIEINFYGKTAERFLKVQKNAHLYISESTIRHDLQSRQYSLHGGTFALVNDQFPILNTVILTGRCVKDIDRDEERAFKTTENGLMICNQTLSVNTGKGQADLFNFFAINQAEDKLNYAELLVNFTKKGTGLTIKGRLVTDSWIDKTSNQKRTNTKIQLVRMTLAPKQSGTQSDSGVSATLPPGAPVKSLWGGRTADQEAEPWGINTGSLHDLPAPSFANGNDEEPPF
jgi:single-stranded DNA-binding protein